MADDKKPNTASEFLDRLTEFLTSYEDRDLQDLKQDLRKEGVDPEQIVVRVQQMVKAKLKEHQLAWKGKAQQERLTALDRLQKIKPDIPRSRHELEEKILAILRGMSSGKPRAFAQAFFRKFERATDNDLKSLLDDLERLDWLEDSTSKHDEGSK